MLKIELSCLGEECGPQLLPLEHHAIQQFQISRALRQQYDQDFQQFVNNINNATSLYFDEYKSFLDMSNVDIVPHQQKTAIQLQLRQLINKVTSNDQFRSKQLKRFVAVYQPVFEAVENGEVEALLLAKLGLHLAILQLECALNGTDFKVIIDDFLDECRKCVETSTEFVMMH